MEIDATTAQSWGLIDRTVPGHMEAFAGHHLSAPAITGVVSPADEGGHEVLGLTHHRLADWERAHPGDVIATRRNDRRLITTSGEPVRNRETWTVTAIRSDRALTVTHERGHGTISLPVEYVRDHVRLGYAATEHGYESDTVTAGIELASAATTRRGLYVGSPAAATRT